MEGRINEYLKTNHKINKPYTNHYGIGSPIGSGSEFGNGRAYTFNNRTDNYNGSSIVSFNKNKVYHINGYTLYITHIHEPWAKAEIIKNDLTTQTCYIGKINDYIAISDSIKGALCELRELISKGKNNDDEMLKAFVFAHPNYNKEYDWDEMVFWHSVSSYSCAEGRRRFSDASNKDIGSKATPKELIELMKKNNVKMGNKLEQLYKQK
jgi:hypothetical protein